MMTKNWTTEQVNRLLVSLPPDEQARIVEYGVMLRLADLRRQLSHAQGVVKEMGAKYHTTIEQLEQEGLPDDAGWEMHEDYIMWHHYTERTVRIEKTIGALQEGLNSPPRRSSDAS